MCRYGGEERRNFEDRDNLEDLGVDGWIILKCTLKKWVRAWTGLMCLRTVADELCMNMVMRVS
jgi:hypothetical protein